LVEVRVIIYKPTPCCPHAATQQKRERKKKLASSAGGGSLDGPLGALRKVSCTRKDVIYAGTLGPAVGAKGEGAGERQEWWWLAPTIRLARDF
jgi:hypothetical protein